MIQNGRANMADMKTKASYWRHNFNLKQTLSYFQYIFKCLFESTWAFQSGLHHLKWQIQNGSHVKQHPQRRKKSVAKTKLFHKVRRKIA